LLSCIQVSKKISNAKRAGMAKDSCLVLVGNSVFLAGIKAVLERCLAFELVTLEAGQPDGMNLIRLHKPRAVLFDLAMGQPDFVVPLLRDQPDLLLIGVDPSSNEMLVLSSHPAQALSISDLVEVIQGRDTETGRIDTAGIGGHGEAGSGRRGDAGKERGKREKI
jgi:hypothetical protein